MLKYNLKRMFRLRGITKPTAFLISAGFTKTTANKIASGFFKVLSTNNTLKLCNALNCTPDALYQYIPDPRFPLAPKHPLNTLIRNDEPSLLELAATLTPEQIKQITDSLKSQT
jgi:DNA-binding Xre family transcriptional regulator